MLRNKIHKISAFLITSIFILFTQVYPFIHLHLDEDEYGAEIAISVHPIDNTSELPGNEFHHEQDQDKHVAGYQVFRPSNSSRNIVPGDQVFLIGQSIIIFDLTYIYTLPFFHQKSKQTAYNYTKQSRSPPLH